MKQALNDGIFFSACTFADKLVTMSAGHPEDVLLLARCHVGQGSYRQALEALRKYRLFDPDSSVHLRDGFVHKSLNGSSAGTASLRPADKGRNHRTGPGEVGYSEGKVVGQHLMFDSMKGSMVSRSFNGDLETSGRLGRNAVPLAREVTSSATTPSFMTNAVDPSFIQSGEFRVEECSFGVENSFASSEATPKAGSEDDDRPQRLAGPSQPLDSFGTRCVWLQCHLLAAQCLAACNEDDECLLVLERAVGGEAGAEEAACQAMTLAQQYNAHQQRFNCQHHVAEQRGPVEHGSESHSAGVAHQKGPSGSKDEPVEQIIAPPSTVRSAPASNTTWASVHKDALSSHLPPPSSVMNSMAPPPNRTPKSVTRRAQEEGEEEQQHEQRLQWEIQMPQSTLSPSFTASTPNSSGFNGRVGSSEALNLRACCCALLGRVFDRHDKVTSAITWLILALRVDPYCADAFECLVTRHLLSATEEQEMLAHLPWRNPDDEWLRAYYATRLSPYDQTAMKLEKCGASLSDESETSAAPSSSSSASTPLAARDSKFDQKRHLGQQRQQQHPLCFTAATAAGIACRRFSHPAIACLLGGAVDQQGNDLADIARMMSDRGLNSGKHDLRGTALIGWSNEASQRRHEVPAGRVREPNVDLLAAKANLLWHQNDIPAAYAEARRAFDLEPLSDAVLPVLAAAMVELKLKAELFKYSHKVGCLILRHNRNPLLILTCPPHIFWKAGRSIPSSSDLVVCRWLLLPARVQE